MKLDDILLLQFRSEMFCKVVMKWAIDLALTYLVTKRALQRHWPETVLVILCIAVTFCNFHVDHLSQKDNGCLGPPHVQSNSFQRESIYHGLSLDFAKIWKELCIMIASSPPICHRESGVGVRVGVTKFSTRGASESASSGYKCIPEPDLVILCQCLLLWKCSNLAR